MLVIFDVDGTLLGGEAHDWSAFDRALNDVVQFIQPPGFFTELVDVTAETICEAVMRFCGKNCGEELIGQIRTRYLRYLERAHQTYPNAFPARPGVKELLRSLQTNGMPVAIATGDWLPTISFKLRCAEIDVSHLPLATASDAKRRSDIIRIAIEKAGGNLEQTVYVGDGVWDLRACRELGIPFIGTGARTERLIEGGAEYICEHLHFEKFTEILRLLTTPGDNLRISSIPLLAAAESILHGIQTRK